MASVAIRPFRPLARLQWAAPRSPVCLPVAVVARRAAVPSQDGDAGERR